MSKWKWLCAFGSFSVAMVACSMPEAQRPSVRPTPAAGEPVARMVQPGPGISTLDNDTDRGQFDIHLTDQLTQIDARIREDKRLYDAGSPADKDRMSERWQTALDKRAALDENRKILDATMGADWIAPKADVVTNLTILEKALDDIEFVFRK